MLQALRGYNTPAAAITTITFTDFTFTNFAGTKGSAATDADDKPLPH